MSFNYNKLTFLVPTHLSFLFICINNNIVDLTYSEVCFPVWLLIGSNAIICVVYFAFIAVSIVLINVILTLCVNYSVDG